MGTKTRKALEIEDALGDLGTVTLAGAAARESSRIGFEVLKRNLRAGPGDRRGRRAQPESSRSPRSIARRSATSTPSSQQEKNANAVGGPGPRDAGLRARAPVRPAGPGTALHGRGDHARRPGAVPRCALEAGRLGARSSRATSRWPRPPSSPGKTSAAGAGGAAADRLDPAAGPGRGRKDLRRGPAGRRADGRHAVPSGARAPDARLLRPEPGGRRLGRRRLRHAAEPEPPRGEGLLLRRLLQPRSLPTTRESGIAGGGVQTNKTKESVVEFDKELKDIGGGKPISEAEFADARAKRVRGYAQQFESLSRINEQIADLWSDGSADGGASARVRRDREGDDRGRPTGPPRSMRSRRRRRFCSWATSRRSSRA